MYLPKQEKSIWEVKYKVSKWKIPAEKIEEISTEKIEEISTSIFMN
jgi:hypothetical protein